MGHRRSHLCSKSYNTMEYAVCVHLKQENAFFKKKNHVYFSN